MSEQTPLPASKEQAPKPPYDLSLPKITVQMLGDYGHEGFFEKTDKPVGGVAGVNWSQAAVDFACEIVRPAVWAEIERLQAERNTWQARAMALFYGGDPDKVTCGEIRKATDGYNAWLSSRSGDSTAQETVDRLVNERIAGGVSRPFTPETGVNEGVKCTHCNGMGCTAQHYDEEHGWSDNEDCTTCGATGRIRTVEQYLKTLPANWHEDSSLETWFPLSAEEHARYKQALTRANGFLIMHGHEPVKLEYDQQTAAPETSATLIAQVLPYIQQFECADAAELEAKALIVSRAERHLTGFAQETSREPQVGDEVTLHFTSSLVKSREGWKIDRIAREEYFFLSDGHGSQISLLRGQFSLNGSVPQT